jgi:O-succinylhomoserine sulfhydrylase
MFENRLAALEGAEACRATSTGMSAVFFTLLALLKSGDRIVAARQLFGSCHYIVADLLPKYGIQGEFVDGGDLAQWEKALSKPTQAVLFESPSNPMLDIVESGGAISPTAGARSCLITPLPRVLRPLEWRRRHRGSLSTSHRRPPLGGAVLGSRVHLEKLQPIIRNTGPSLQPFNAGCWWGAQGPASASIATAQRGRVAARGGSRDLARAHRPATTRSISSRPSRYRTSAASSPSTQGGRGRRSRR